MPLLDFTSRRKVMIRGQDDVRSVYFVIIGWGRGKKGRAKTKSKPTTWLTMYASVGKIPF